MCSSCLADQIRLQSSKMEITVCPKCGALKINKNGIIMILKMY
ncbi:hypothetical protein [Acidiplasma cupricumulans]|nr:hypothetical protein [Acidiplasma cupricumulans]